MLKDQTNQDFKDIVSLMGQKVSFISSLKVQDELSELLEFQLLA